nr:hypothetical protein [Tanacetum cinerariifolium]
MHTVKNDMVIHTKKSEMVILVVEIEYVGMIADVVDKVTCPFDRLQLEQVDQKYVHALNEPHLHDIRVVLNKHEVNQHLSCADPLLNYIHHKFTPLRRKSVQKLRVHLKIFQLHVVDIHIIEEQ